MDAPKARIWELDAFRGIAILAVILIHLLFDLRYFLGLSLGYDNTVFQFVKQYGGVVFVVLSGICVTLGRRSFRRGLIVFGCAMAVTLVTLAMVWLGLDSGSVVVRFGVLHLLGIACCAGRCCGGCPPGPWWPSAFRWWDWATGSRPFMYRQDGSFPWGLTSAGFSSSDYFPLFPHLGWFLLGAALGRTAYREKRSLLPRVNAQCKPSRFFCWCGRMSLFLYLLHQPLLYGLVMILAALR